MGYKDMIQKIDSRPGLGYKQGIMLKDIKFMLSELKQSKKLGLLDATDRKDLMSFVNDLQTSARFRREKISWEYDPYFRLKAMYLNFKGVAD